MGPDLDFDCQAWENQSDRNDTAQVNQGIRKAAIKIRIVQLPDVRGVEQVLHHKELPHRQASAGVLQALNPDKQRDDDDMGGHGDERNGDAGK